MVICMEEISKDRIKEELSGCKFGYYVGSIILILGFIGIMYSLYLVGAKPVNELGDPIEPDSLTTWGSVMMGIIGAVAVAYYYPKFEQLKKML